MSGFGEKFNTEPFHETATKLELGKVLEKEINVKDIRLYTDFKTEFGNSIFVSIFFNFTGEPKKDYTTLCSGRVVIDKCVQAKANKYLPLTGTIKKVVIEGKANWYYDII